MRVKLENPAVLTKAIDIISDLVSEVRIKVNEFGFGISAIDPATVALVSLKLPRSSFAEYEADNEILGVNLNDLKQILKRCGSSSTLILENKDNVLNITIEDRIKRNFTLGLVEVEGEDIDFNEKISRMEFSSSVEISPIDLIASIEDCSVVADACSFIIEDGKFLIKAKGMNSAMSEFSGDEAKIEAEDCSARYSLEYLQKFMKGVKLGNSVVLKFANSNPLLIRIKNDHLEMGFVLAPRVENDY